MKERVETLSSKRVPKSYRKRKVFATRWKKTPKTGVLKEKLQQKCGEKVPREGKSV